MRLYLHRHSNDKRTWEPYPYHNLVYTQRESEQDIEIVPDPLGAIYIEKCAYPIGSVDVYYRVSQHAKPGKHTESITRYSPEV